MDYLEQVDADKNTEVEQVDGDKNTKVKNKQLYIDQTKNIIQKQVTKKFVYQNTFVSFE